MTTPQHPSHDDPWWHAPQSPPMAHGPQPPTTSTMQMPATPAPKPPRRRRPWVAVALCLAGLFVGASGTAAYEQLTSGSTTVLEQAQSVDEPIATTSPATAPTTTAPAGRTPSSTTTPPTTPPSTRTPSSQSGSTSTASLTKGVVNINTELAYEQAEGAGTGIVLTANGQILTNNHVIEGATTITVTIIDTGKEYTATVMGTDATNDVALLQLENASGLTVASIGDSDTVKIGDAVTGVGNAGGTGTPTASKGAVTDLGQTITATDSNGGNAETLHNLIEISAQLQPGQSGGPLFNAAGQVIGVDSAGSSTSPFRSRSGTTITGSGYAIPINDALDIVEQIRSGEGTDTVTIGTPPMLGVGVADTSPVGSGARVISIAEGTPAAGLGLKVGDVIIAIGGTSVTSPDQLGATLHTHKAGDKVKVTWTSNGTTRSGTVTLIAGPAN